MQEMTHLVYNLKGMKGASTHKAKVSPKYLKCVTILNVHRVGRNIKRSVLDDGQSLQLSTIRRSM